MRKCENPECDNIVTGLTTRGVFKKHCSSYCMGRHIYFKSTEKRKLTMLERHGVEYPLQSNAINTKSKQTCLTRHGVENPMHSPTIKEKVNKTCLERHGNTRWAGKHISHGIQQLINDPIWLKQQNETKSLEEMSVDLNINKLIIFRRFNKFNIKVKRHSASYFEKQVYEFVKSIYHNTINNDNYQIHPYEIDIYLPDLNLGFECNGEPWHKDPQREINKFNMCKEKGIKLYFIWYKDWQKDKEKEKEKIKNIINEKM